MAEKARTLLVNKRDLGTRVAGDILLPQRHELGPESLTRRVSEASDRGPALVCGVQSRL